MQRNVNPEDTREILRILRYRNTPVTSNDLVEMTGLSDPQVRRAIRELNFAGHPIVSGSDGFRITDNPDDVFEYAASLYERARWIQDRADILESIGHTMRTGERLGV